MTPLENKIWDMVSNWAKAQYYPINDMALRGLMDDILALVNESSKEAEIKKLVEEYRDDINAVKEHRQSSRLEKDEFKTMYLSGCLYQLKQTVFELENILNGMDKSLPKPPKE